MKKHNFSAGPSILPREVIEETAKAILDFNGSGLSVLEVSIVARIFRQLWMKPLLCLRKYLTSPKVFGTFPGRWCSMQFCMVPYNFLEKKAAYLNTGVWAKKSDERGERLWRSG